MKRLKNGRPGMDLWQILVLGQIRLGCNLSYDACRKCLDMIKRLKKGNDSDVLVGWRKAEYWGNKLKNVSRQIGQNSKKRGWK